MTGKSGDVQLEYEEAELAARRPEAAALNIFQQLELIETLVANPRRRFCSTGRVCHATCSSYGGLKLISAFQIHLATLRSLEVQSADTRPESWAASNLQSYSKFTVPDWGREQPSDANPL